MSSPITDVKIVDGVFVKMHHFVRSGDTHQGHAHVFDHITLLAVGSVLMRHDNGEQEFTAPHLIVTPKGITHQFIALEPHTVFCCVHALRDDFGEIIDSETDPDVARQYVKNLVEQ